MTNTDTQLKQALARMLPDEIVAYGISKLTLFWAKDYTGTTIDGGARVVLDTELLHLCWLVEVTLNQDQLDDYDDQVFDIMNTPEALPIHATWQQKVIGLAKQLNIEII